MLDFSFGEILVIAVIAVIFLGPDKLPQTFVKIAKFLRAVKKTINDAKDTLDREIHITEMKQDALEYKKKFEDSALKLKDDILESADLEGTKAQIDGVKSEIESLKVANKLNAPLEESSVKNLTFDEVESKGLTLQNRLKKNLKAKDLGESSGKSKATKARVAKDSSESKTAKKATKSTKPNKSKRKSKDLVDSKPKKRESKKAQSKSQTKRESKSKKTKKSKDEAK